MSIPYRTRKAMKAFFAGLLVLVLFAILLLVCWFLWLDRYVIYSQDGARLDFDLSVNYGPGETPVEPPALIPPEIHNKTEGEGENASSAFAQFSGYFVSLEELTGDFDATAQKLRDLPKGSTIVLELKDLKGYMYCTSDAGRKPKEFDVSLMDDLIKELQDDGHYLIAQIPAFQEYYFIMTDQRERVPYGLPKVGGNGSLWLDSTGKTPCYWLNPSSDGTMTFLLQLVTEIRNMGFDEVLFSGFRFPDTDKIKYDGDKMEALASTAATLVNTCATDSFAVSFTRSAADLKLPEGRTRLYLENVSAADAEAMAQQAGVADTASQLVFITDSEDPRYADYSTLRSLDSAE